MKASYFGFKRSAERIYIGHYDGWDRIFALSLLLIFLILQFIVEMTLNEPISLNLYYA